MWFFPSIVAALAGVGFLSLYSERKLIQKGFLSYKWPQVKAVIEDQRDDSFFITGFSYSQWSWGKMTFREVGYIYKYKIGNHIYHSSNYCFGGHSDRAKATYVIGQHVRISYNPDNPKEAVIKRGVTPGALIGLLPLSYSIIGVIMMVFNS